MLVNKKLILIIIILLSLEGCSSLTQKSVNSHVYNEAPSDNDSLKAIHRYIDENFKDPQSAIQDNNIRCIFPARKAGFYNCPDGPMTQSCGDYYGYLVSCKINAKNSYGAFTGFKQYYFSIKGVSINPTAVRVTAYKTFIYAN